jgi:hypothetical protein
MVPARALPVLLHVLLAAVASGSPDDGLAEVEPDLRVVTRRGPSGFGVVARLTSSGFGEVNLITGLRGTAAEDGLLRVGDLVLEVDGDRIPPGESLVSVVKRLSAVTQCDSHTLGVLRPLSAEEQAEVDAQLKAEAEAAAEAEPPSLAAIMKSMLGNPAIRGAVSKMAASHRLALALALAHALALALDLALAPALTLSR